MSKHFYSHLVDLNSLLKELDSLDLTPRQKKELAQIAHDNVHSAVTDAILSELSETDKRKFLTLLSAGADEKIWEHLNQNVEKIEDKIETAAKQIKTELQKDIRELIFEAKSKEIKEAT